MNKTVKKYQSDPIHENVRMFERELKQKFPQLRVTSGYRKRAFTKQGNVSRHSKGEALDLGYDKEIADYLSNTYEGVGLLNKYGLGVLDESTKEVMDKTGATGAHLHVGMDSGLVAKARERYKQLTPKENITPELTDFDYTPQTPTFALEDTNVEEETPKEEDKSKEVAQAKEVLREEQFLSDMFKGNITPIQVAQEEVPQQAPQSNLLESFANIEAFVDTPLAQQGGTIYVESKNDPRYKAYQDSLQTYKKSNINWNNIKNYENSEVLKNGNVYISEDELRELNIKNPKTNLNPFYFNIATSDFHGTGYGRDVKIPMYKKPKEKVVIQPDLPRVESIKLPPINIQKSELEVPQNLVKTNLPLSYNIKYDAPNLIGGQMPIESTFLDGKEVSLEEMQNIITKKNNYNSYIEEKYGNEEALKNPKSVERLNKLKQSLEITPNYKQEGGYTEDEQRFITEYFQQGGIIPISSRGMYDFPNEKVIVPTNGSITMKGIPHKIKATSLETGETKILLPGLEYFFDKTQNVLEIPLKK